MSKEECLDMVMEEKPELRRISQERVHAAMDMYAAQESIAFAKWIQANYHIAGTFEQLFTRYTKNKLL